MQIIKAAFISDQVASYTTQRRGVVLNQLMVVVQDICCCCGGRRLITVFRESSCWTQWPLHSCSVPPSSPGYFTSEAGVLFRGMDGVGEGLLERSILNMLRRFAFLKFSFPPPPPQNVYETTASSILRPWSSKATERSLWSHVLVPGVELRTAEKAAETRNWFVPKQRSCSISVRSSLLPPSSKRLSVVLTMEAAGTSANVCL